MSRHSFGGYQADIDEQRTANWYEQAEKWGCNCGHCRNFVQLARRRQLPPRTLAALDTLGIPPEKATYVGELYTDEAGLHYQFSYRIAGTIAAEPPADEAWPWDAGRCCHEVYPYGAPGFPSPHFDLEFYAALPWVLETPQQGE